MPGPVRILFVADSHLGFDLPVRPRVNRRRRGHDFLTNYAAALEPAMRGEVDLVVHGGDVTRATCVPGHFLHYSGLSATPALTNSCLKRGLVRIGSKTLPAKFGPAGNDRSSIAFSIAWRARSESSRPR